MSEPNPYEPPADSGSPLPGAGGTEPPAYPPTGSVYESANYQPPEEATPPPPPPPPPPPIAGGPPPGYQPAYPPPGAYAAAPAKDNTQLFGILGIVFAVVCCPLLGVLFGWLSMNEAKKTGSDATIGKVAFWVAIGICAFWVVGTVFLVCAGGLGTWNERY